MSLSYYLMTCIFFIAAVTLIGFKGDHMTSIIAVVALILAAMSAFAGHVASEGVMTDWLYYAGQTLQALSVGTAIVALVYYCLDLNG